LVPIPQAWGSIIPDQIWSYLISGSGISESVHHASPQSEQAYGWDTWALLTVYFFLRHE